MVENKRLPDPISKIAVVIVVLLVLLVFSIILQRESREKVFGECVEHVDYSKTHTHTTLTILQNGEKIVIPKNLGITSECMHPLHTHDSTGLIHMEFPKPIIFYLGDFFDLMGVVFDDKQIGTLKTIDGYRISVKRNGELIKNNYRSISLKDLEKIEITVVSDKY